MIIHIMSRTVDAVLCNGVQSGGNATGSEDAVKQCKRPQQVQAYSSQVYFLSRQFSSTNTMASSTQNYRTVRRGQQIKHARSRKNQIGTMDKINGTTFVVSRPAGLQFFQQWPNRLNHEKHQINAEVTIVKTLLTDVQTWLNYFTTMLGSVTRP